MLIMTKTTAMQPRCHRPSNTINRLSLLLPFLIIHVISSTNAWVIESQINTRRKQRRLSTHNAGLQRQFYCRSPLTKQPQKCSPFTSAFSPSLKFTATTTTCLLQQPSSNNNINNKKKQVAADGTQRGAWLLGAVLLACLWIFTIPPEFRRAYLCGSDRCVQNRSAYLCNDCMTPDEWKQGIVDYYRSGGGVKFDFSIDPNSKMKLF
jgi:hypothetical protein